MSTQTGEVKQFTDEELAARPDKRDWAQFNVGEIIEVRGIRFRVHDVSDQRLVLKFARD